MQAGHLAYDFRRRLIVDAFAWDISRRRLRGALDNDALDALVRRRGRRRVSRASVYKRDSCFLFQSESEDLGVGPWCQCHHKTYDGAEGRPLLDLVIKGMSVVDRDGTHVGTVDKVEGGHLKILRPDQRPRNQHQYVTPNWIVAVDDRVRLNLTIDEAKRLWATEPYAKRHDLHRPK